MINFVEFKEITLDELFERYKSYKQVTKASFEELYDLYKDIYGYHII